MLNTEDINKYKTIDDYVKLIQEKGVSSFIEVIKIKEILINRYGGKIKTNLIEKIDKYVYANRNIDEKVMRLINLE